MTLKKGQIMPFTYGFTNHTIKTMGLIFADKCDYCLADMATVQDYCIKHVSLIRQQDKD